MVEDEGEAGQSGGRRRAGGELVRQHHQVVDQTGVGDGLEASAHVGPQQPLGVGFALDLVADALQVTSAREFGEPGQGVGDVRAREVGPADHSGDEFAVVREGEELRGLLLDGDGLHEDGGRDTGRLRARASRSLEREVPPDRGELLAGDPVLVAHGEVPDVVVRVDDRGHHSSQTTGRPASAPSAE